MAKGHITSADY